MTLQSHEGKLVVIQLLRALAAFTVAAAHLGWAFADHIGDGLGLGAAPNRWAQGAVLLFFLVSGYIMVIASQPLYGRAGGWRIFAVRRLVRILPIYWLATFALMAITALLFARQFDLHHTALSLALVPFWPAEGPQSAGFRAVPILWPGWTLFYELLFYALFSLGLPWGKRCAVIGAALGCAGLAVAGLVIAPDNALLFMATRPVMLTFIVGMALALWGQAGGQLPAHLRLALIGAAVAAGLLIDRSEGSAGLDFAYLAWTAIPAMLIFVAAIAGPLTVPAPAAVTLAGDASYALYLFHLPLAWLGLWAYGKLGFVLGAWGYWLIGLVLVFAASLVIHLLIERPVTAGLRTLVGRKPSLHHTP